MTTIYGGAGKFRGQHGKRDSMRAKCYRAERSTPMWDVMQWGKRATVEQCQGFVDKALARQWVRRQFGRRHVTVTDSGGKGGACASYGTIYVSTYYRNHLVLLHELAHCLTPNDVGHGRDWARAYVQLVTSMMGPESGKALRQAFRKAGVKTRKVTAAQRLAGRRLAAMAKQRSDGGAALATYRAKQATDKAELLAAGWQPGKGRHAGWHHPTKGLWLERAQALDWTRSGKLAAEPDDPDAAAHVAVYDSRPRQQAEAVQLVAAGWTRYGRYWKLGTAILTQDDAVATLVPEPDPYAPVWPEPWQAESRAEYLAAVYPGPAGNETTDATSMGYVPE